MKLLSKNIIRVASYVLVAAVCFCGGMFLNNTSDTDNITKTKIVKQDEEQTKTKEVKHDQATFAGMTITQSGWRAVNSNRVDYGYTGMALNEYGWWYFRNGQLDFNYTGMACNEYGWWFFVNGRLDLGYTGMACNEYGWWYYTNGQLDWNYTGMASNEYGWWYYQNGRLVWDYTGFASNEYGTWYYSNGNLNQNYTGMVLVNNTWYYVSNGLKNSSFTGVAYNSYGGWYFTNGSINWKYSGIWENPSTATGYYILNGTVDSTYDIFLMNSYKSTVTKLDYDADAVFIGDSLVNDSDFQSYFSATGKKIVNLGTSGSTTTALEYKIPMAESLTPEAIFFEVGINDLMANHDMDNVLAEYERVLKTYSQKTGANIYVCSLLPVASFKEGTYASNSQIAAYNSKLAAMAARNGFTYVDLYSQFVSGGYMNPSYTVDGIHLNSAGYAIWGEAIRSYI